MFGHEKGFTLIEVLVASLILFSVLTISTNIYRSSIKAVEKVSAITLISRALPFVREDIKTKIFQKEIKGEDVFNKNISYTWHCAPLETSKNIISAYDEFTGGLQYGHFNLALNKVFLTIKYGNGFLIKEKKYQYKELSWTR